MSEALAAQAPEDLAEAARWHLLYRIAGICALLTAVVFIPLSLVAYVLWPSPATVLELFVLFQTNRIGIFLLLLSVLFFWIWSLLPGLRFLRLARAGAQASRS